jgi:hypothetical protein
MYIYKLGEKRQNNFDLHRFSTWACERKSKPDNLYVEIYIIHVSLEATFLC